MLYLRLVLTLKLIIQRCYIWTTVITVIFIIHSVYFIGKWIKKIILGIKFYKNTKTQNHFDPITSLFLVHNTACLQKNGASENALFQLINVQYVCSQVSSIDTALALGGEAASSSPVSAIALVKIECVWNSLGQGTHC